MSSQKTLFCWMHRYLGSYRIIFFLAWFHFLSCCCCYRFLFPCLFYFFTLKNPTFQNRKTTTLDVLDPQPCINHIRRPRAFKWERTKQYPIDFFPKFTRMKFHSLRIGYLFSITASWDRPDNIHVSIVLWGKYSNYYPVLKTVDRFYSAHDVGL